MGQNEKRSANGVREMWYAFGFKTAIRLELRCENGGHGYFLLVRNHEGQSAIEFAEIGEDASPWCEGARW